MSTKVSKSDQPHVPVLGDEIAKLGPNPLQATVDRLRSDVALATETITKCNSWIAEAKPLLERGGGAERDLAASQERCEALEALDGLVESLRRSGDMRLENIKHRDQQIACAEVDRLRTDLDAARAEAERAKADTERLDWLEANPAAIREKSVNKSWGRKVWWMGPTGDYDTAREAIDAARADAARKEQT